MSEKGFEINTCVLDAMRDDIQGIKGDFGERFKQHLFDPNYARFEKDC